MSVLLACVLALGEPKPPSFAIVAPREFHVALAVLAEHRRSQLPTSVIALEEILGTEEGVDAPEKIKRRLHREWREQGLRYALLVGDASKFPVRWMTLDRIDAAARDVAFYPSDLYFADVARADGSFDDWNAAKDGVHARYFGEVRGEKHKTPPMNFDGIDYVPEIAVGRWLVRTVPEIEMRTGSSLALERDPPPAVAAFAVVDGWVDARGAYDAAAKRMTSPLAIRRLFYGSDALPSADNVLALLEERASFVAHAGHGTPSGWEGSLQSADVASAATKRADAARQPAPAPTFDMVFVPRDAVPVPRAQLIASAGCSTAVIATQPPYEAYVDVDGKRHAGTTAGEVFTESPPPPAPIQPKEHCVASFGWAAIEHGASAAYFGCTTGSQPCALTLVEELAVAWPTSARAGDAWIACVTRYVEREKLRELVPTDDWYPASIFFQGMKFVFLGDPSMPVVWRKESK